VSWTGGSTAFNQAVIFVRSLIIARLLTTTDYGLFGMATLVMHGMTVLTEFNLTSVVYTLKYESVEVRDRHLNTAWTADLVRRAAVSAILFAVSYPVSLYFRDERIFPLLMATSITPFISGFVNVGLIQLQKDLAFKRVVIHQQLTEIITTIVGIAVAWITRSVWALVLGLLASSCASVVMSYVLCAYRPRFQFDREALVESVRFGKHMFLIGLLTFVTTQFDNIVVGRYLGAAVLGAYMLAYRLANLPVDIVSTVLGAVLFPLYAKVNQDSPEALQPIFLKISNLTATALLLMLGPLGFMAGPIVRFLYGEKWESAIPFLTVLVFVGVFRGLPRGLNGVFAALRRPDVSSTTKVFEVMIFVPLTLALVPIYGGFGAAVAGACSYAFGWVYQLFRVLHFFPAHKRFVFQRLLAPALSAAIAMVVCLSAQKAGLHPFGVAVLFDIILLGTVLILDPALREELRRFRRIF
jgi:O-antigen/teichoic acid export membrane protein